MIVTTDLPAEWLEDEDDDDVDISARSIEHLIAAPPGTHLVTLLEDGSTLRVEPLLAWVLVQDYPMPCPLTMEGVIRPVGLAVEFASGRVFEPGYGGYDNLRKWADATQARRQRDKKP